MNATEYRFGGGSGDGPGATTTAGSGGTDAREPAEALTALRELVAADDAHQAWCVLQRLKPRPLFDPSGSCSSADGIKVPEYPEREAIIQRLNRAWEAARAALAGVAAKQPDMKFAWLWTHCRALGMTKKSDSGTLEHDIALFIIDLKAAAEAKTVAPVAEVRLGLDGDAAIYVREGAGQWRIANFTSPAGLDVLPLGTKLYASPHPSEAEVSRALNLFHEYAASQVSEQAESAPDPYQERRDEQARRIRGYYPIVRDVKQAESAPLTGNRLLGMAVRWERLCRTLPIGDPAQEVAWQELQKAAVAIDAALATSQTESAPLTDERAHEILTTLLSTHADWLKAFKKALGAGVRQPELGNLPERASMDAAYDKVLSAIAASQPDAAEAREWAQIAAIARQEHDAGDGHFSTAQVELLERAAMRSTEGGERG